MRKLLALVLAAMVLFAFAGCGRKSLSEEEIPTDGIYHEGYGILLRLGMTKEEIDDQIKEYGWEDQGEGIIQYHLGNLRIQYEGGEAAIFICNENTAPDWILKGGIHIGSDYDELKQKYEPYHEGSIQQDNIELNTAIFSIENTYALTVFYYPESRELENITIYNYMDEDKVEEYKK